MTTSYERIKRMAARRRQGQEITITFRSAEWAEPASKDAPTPDPGPQPGDDEPERDA